MSPDERSVLAFVDLREAMFHGSPRPEKIRQALPDVDVDAALKRLQQEGYIKTVRRKARVIVYTVTPSGHAALSRDGSGEP